MKIILFDIDETLLSCKAEADSKGSRKMFKMTFQIDTDEEMINHTGKTEKAIIEDVIRFIKEMDSDEEVEIPNKAYQVWAEGVGEILEKYPPIVLPGVRNLLETLAKSPDNIIMGILTGNSRIRAEVKLKAAGLDHFFMKDTGILNGAFKREDLIPEAKQKYGKGTYIVIDDSIVAGKMIKEDNIPAILVGTGKASIDQLKQYSQYVFQNFGENRWQEAVEVINNIPD